MKTWIIPLIIAGMFWGCARVRSPLVEEDSSGVRTTIRAIWEAAKTYNCDKGNWPTTVEDLLQARYLDIDSGVWEQWRFVLIDGPPQEIRAISTEPIRKGAGDFEWTAYDVLRGTWKGYPMTPFRGKELTFQEKAELASSARQVMEDIWRTAQWYYNDKGEWPETVAELEKNRYMEVDIGVDSTWQFAIIGSPPKAIVAVSKNGMPDGAGRALEFDVVSGVWRGYGQP